MIPGSFAYCYLGYAGGCALLDNDKGFPLETQIKLGIASVLLALLVVLPILLRKRFFKKPA